MTGFLDAEANNVLGPPGLRAADARRLAAGLRRADRRDLPHQLHQAGRREEIVRLLRKGRWAFLLTALFLSRPLRRRSRFAKPAMGPAAIPRTPGIAFDRRPAEAVHGEPAGAVPRGDPQVAGDDAADGRHPDKEIQQLAEHFSKQAVKPESPASTGSCSRRGQALAKKLRCGDLPPVGLQRPEADAAPRRPARGLPAVRDARLPRQPAARHHHDRRAIRREGRRDQGAGALPVAQRCQTPARKRSRKGVRTLFSKKGSSSSSFGGRPRGRKVHFRPSRSAIVPIQLSAP